MSPKTIEKLTIGCVAGPGGSVVTRTGDWRTMRPVFKHVTCTGCRACEMVCPEGCVFEDTAAKHVLEKDGKTREVNNREFDPTYCKGCGMCAHECPVDDIDMVMEAK